MQACGPDHTSRNSFCRSSTGAPGASSGTSTGRPKNAARFLRQRCCSGDSAGCSCCQVQGLGLSAAALSALGTALGLASPGSDAAAALERCMQQVNARSNVSSLGQAWRRSARAVCADGRGKWAGCGPRQFTLLLLLPHACMHAEFSMPQQPAPPATTAPMQAHIHVPLPAAQLLPPPRPAALNFAGSSSRPWHTCQSAAGPGVPCDAGEGKSRTAHMKHT